MHNTEDEKNYTFLIISSLFIGALVGYTTYYLLQWIDLANIYTRKELFTYISVLFSIFSFSLSFFMIAIIERNIKSRKRSKELNDFRDYAEAVTNSSKESEMYKHLQNYLNNIFSSTKVSIYFDDSTKKASDSWTLISNSTYPLCNMSPNKCPVVLTQKDLNITDIACEIVCPNQHSEFKTGSYVCVLTSTFDHPSAVVQLYNRRKHYFDWKLLRDIKSYIEIITPIIEKKKRITTLNKEAYTDKLTKAPNRTYLEKYLPFQVQQSLENNTNLSLLMLDIDFFKKVNDNYGHAAGDAVLMIFAKVIKRCLRKSDTFARYGGEEFVVILPKTNIDTAETIAERIRYSVNNEPMPVFQGVQLPQISCSIGISCIPDLANNQETLHKTADIALYNCKTNGRNRVMVYHEGMEM